MAEALITANDGFIVELMVQRGRMNETFGRWVAVLIKYRLNQKQNGRGELTHLIQPGHQEALTCSHCRARFIILQHRQIAEAMHIGTDLMLHHYNHVSIQKHNSEVALTTGCG